MALEVHHGPSTFLSPLLLLLFFFLLQFPTAKSTGSSLIDGNKGINLITAILFITLIFALFFLGFFTAYFRRCLGIRTISTNATVAAAAAAAFNVHNPANRRRRGLDPAVIECFPAVPYSFIRKIKPSKYGADSLECSVCLGEFSDDDILRLLPGCRHVFHASCIDTWLDLHITCPVCRANLSDPTLIAAGQCLLEELVEEQLTDPIEIIVEVFRPDMDPDPVSETEMVPAYPESARKEIESARQYRRAASLVSFHGARMSTEPLGSFIRTLSVSGHNRAQLGSGEGSSKQIRMPGNVGDVGKERDYAHSVTFTGFVMHGDVAEDDWLPEIFQVSSTNE